MTPGPLCAAVLTLALLGSSATAMEREHFADYVWGRAGDGEVIHRVSTGLAYDIDSGEVVARLEGHEIAQAVPSKSEPGTIYHVARAMLLYRHPETNAVLTVYPGKDPVALTSVSAYSYTDDGFVYRFGNPKNASPPRTIPGTVTCEKQGSILYCLRGTSYQAEDGRSVLEYRWMVDREATSPEAAARAEFAETEPPHPGISNGPVMIRLTSYRLTSWEAVPESLRAWVEKEAPGFATLPADVAGLVEAAGFAP